MPGMLIRITVVMLFVPVPGGRHDLLEFGKLRFPTQFFEGAFSRSDQTRGIAGTARFFDRRNFLLRNFFAHVDYLPHRISRAIAEIVEALFSRLKRKDVGLRKIDDVYVIANAGAVVRWIIGAVNFALLGLAKRNLEHVRNQMRFDAMMFAKFLAGPSGVEITESDKFESVNCLVP